MPKLWRWNSLRWCCWQMVVITAFASAEGADRQRISADAARRVSSERQLNQIMLALHRYAAEHGEFPPQANYDDDGKPLLSWRVHILPYLEEPELYQRFRLDEPWDSAHNRELISLMPKIYQSPQLETDDRAAYVAAVGKGLFMEGRKGIRLRHIRDGTSKTIALIESAAETAPIWTQPSDWRFDPEDPLAGVHRGRPNGFLAAIADGSVQTIAYAIDPGQLQAWLTRAAGDELTRAAGDDTRN